MCQEVVQFVNTHIFKSEISTGPMEAKVMRAVAPILQTAHLD
jgi:hypothetical protein